MPGTVDYELLLVVLHNDVSRRSTSRLQRKEGQTVLGVDAQIKKGSTSEKAGRCARWITKALYARNLSNRATFKGNLYKSRAIQNESRALVVKKTWTTRGVALMRKKNRTTRTLANEARNTLHGIHHERPSSENASARYSGSRASSCLGH